MDPNERRRNWMSRTQLAFNSGDLAFQEITTSRPNRNSATRVVSLDAVWPVTATSFGPQMDPNERRRNWMSRTQLAFNSGDLAFQEITTSRPNRNSATREVSLHAVWPVTATH